MKKTYRISIRNASRNNVREIDYAVYTSKKKAQAMCDTINRIDPGREATVVVK